MEVEAVSVAAFKGDIASLAKLLHSDATLLTTCDSHGRTALHWAVEGRHPSMVKYLIGRWQADTLLHVQDKAGDTPLHLFAGPPEILKLLHYGGLHKPDVGVRNTRDQTPSMRIAETNSLAQRDTEAMMEHVLHTPIKWDVESTSLYAFLRFSPVRRPPSAARPGIWIGRLNMVDTMIGTLPYLYLVALAVLEPGHSKWLALLLPFGMLVGLLLCGGPSAFFKAVVRTINEPSRRLALLVLNSILLLLGLINGLLGRYLISATPMWAAIECVLQVITCASYYVTVTGDPGFVPGASDADYAAYWQALEDAESGAQQSTPVAAAASVGGSDEEEVAIRAAEAAATQRISGFCPRSELRRIPRGRFSPFAGGMILCFDHDCTFLAVCIGQGNHRAFILLLYSAFSCILLGLHLALTSRPPWLRQGAAREEAPIYVRLYCLGVVVGMLILIPLGLLIMQQSRFILSNVTASEELAWIRNNPLMMLPDRGAPGWDLYAPYDGGRLRNLGRFLRGDRRPPPGLLKQRHDTAAAASRGGVAKVEAGVDVQSELAALQKALKGR